MTKAVCTKHYVAYDTAAGCADCAPEPNVTVHLPNGAFHHGHAAITVTPAEDDEAEAGFFFGRLPELPLDAYAEDAVILGLD